MHRCFPPSYTVAAGVKAQVPSLSEGGPALVIFARGATHHCLEALAQTQYDVIGLDWTIDPAEAVSRLGRVGSR